MGKRQVIIGNWKMYKTIEETIEFIEGLNELLEEKHQKADVRLAVPFTAIRTAAEKLKGSHIMIGAQNMNDAREGAFTGEIAGVMLQEAGAQFVLLGHSERRRYFHEENSSIQRKITEAYKIGLQPVLCIGERAEERRENHTESVLQEQLESVLNKVTQEQSHSLMIAYEPVWAVGTGQPASPSEVSRVISFCRKVLATLWGEEAAEKVLFLYGGSVKEDNAMTYLNENEIEGLLLGAASLDPELFAKIAAL